MSKVHNKHETLNPCSLHCHTYLPLPSHTHTLLTHIEISYFANFTGMRGVVHLLWVMILIFSFISSFFLFSVFSPVLYSNALIPFNSYCCKSKLKSTVPNEFILCTSWMNYWHGLRKKWQHFFFYRIIVCALPNVILWWAEQSKFVGTIFRLANGYGA